jgi:hypothetical protein
MTTTDKPYRIMSYDCFQMHTDDDGYGCEASFDTLDEALAYCRRKMDEQIEDDIAKAEAGELTTSEEIKEARSQVSTFGWSYSIHNKSDPAANDAFRFLDYVTERLTEIVDRKQAEA